MNIEVTYWEKVAMETLFGSLTLTLSIAMVFIGIPGQILKNHRNSAFGMSKSLTWLVLSVYMSRTMYSYSIGAWYILIPDVFGSFFSMVLAWQHMFSPRIAFITTIEQTLIVLTRKK